MKNQEITYLSFEVDKLTNSIENAISGEVFDTIVTRLKTADGNEVKKADWVFNWMKELKDHID